MSELSKQALKVENNQSFPNNTDGLITPTALRGFNEDMIDSLVDEITYNTDSASWDNSIDLLNQFTSSQQPSFTALNAFTQSQLAINSGYNNATQSLQGQITTLVSEVDSLQTFTSSVNEISDNGVVQGISTRLHFYGNVSASIVQNVNGPIASIEIPFSGVDTGSLLTTASFAAQTLTFTKGDGSTFGVVIPDVSGSTINTGSFATTGSNVFIGNQTITGSLLISGSEVVTGPLTASRLQINGITDLNGTLDVSNDATFRGNVIIQSSGEQKLLMRSTSGGGVSQGFDLLIQTSSFIIRDETHDIDFLEFDYISSSADHILKLEANRFEMNSGSLGISGSLTASLQQGYAWVGDSSGRTQAIPTSSFGGGTIDTGSFATTGSNTFDGTQTVKGDVIISASVGAPNQLFIQRSTTGAQQFLRLGPDDNQNNFQFIVTGSDVSPGQPVWGINVQGGQWQNGFDAPTGFINFTNFRSGIELRFGGGQPTARMGVNHISESVQVYAGLSSDGKYIVSSSVDERILEINPTTATVKVSNTISSQIFLNPQTLTGTQTVPSGFNGMLTGPVSNAGTIVIESGSTLVII